MTDGVPEKHDNQNTVGPLSEAEVVRRAKKLLKRSNGKGGKGHDRMALFTEWLRTEPSQYGNAGEFMTAKGLHRGTLQGWGGRIFWNQAREAVRAEALSKAIAKTPDLLERKFERELEVSRAALDLAERMVANMREITDSADAGIKHMTSKQELKALAEAVAVLARLNIDLANNGVQKSEVTAVNFHAAVVKSIQERDAQQGVEPGGPV